MAAQLILLLLLCLSQHMSASIPNTDLDVAISEMRSAKYYSYVLLLQMIERKIPLNITFLMPTDIALSSVLLSENEITKFIFSHSIPTPLLFDHLTYFPSGSMIPTCEPGFMLRMVNDELRGVFLNTVRITEPNVCVVGSIIRCHGVGGVLMWQNMTKGTSAPLPISPPPALPMHQLPAVGPASAPNGSGWTSPMMPFSPGSLGPSKSGGLKKLVSEIVIMGFCIFLVFV
ncbi:hypothetical protein AMTRI_Chr03g51570 [Amborella trichopoda]|uniref:FAS1 domain-containing protein n=1 Tax=Amborella trichopoda TaxID=13333 RepID=U5CZZ7_AMBTC|nr:FAS1 domain-containing protein SELMODRAFT_448915 [Amborella trichopoda]ERN15535.1 hypothetical protein AMTR_s00048p00109350 [Amborella trichopoda]|eukprot:XP_006854068.1 FAS1 domain-containing protein SELMODRAFT_448915 [Amborella trichopoda]